MAVRSVFLIPGLWLIAAAVIGPAAASRERISLDSHWRFIRGDPAGMTADLRYDVRPAYDESGDGKVADA